MKLTSYRKFEKAGIFVLITVIFCVLFMLCGCNKTETVDPVTDGFRCMADVEMKGEKYVCQLTVGSSGSFKMVVDDPVLLKGMTMDWNGEEFLVSYMGMEWNLGNDSLPNTAFATSIRNVLSAVATGQYQSTGNGNDYTVGGGSDSGDFKLTMSSDGYPKALTVPSLELNVTFRDYETA